MFQKIRKNKFFRKALVFASVFLILTTSLVLPILAQAPSIDFDGSSSSTSYNFYYSNPDSASSNSLVFLDFSVFSSGSYVTYYILFDSFFDKYNFSISDDPDDIMDLISDDYSNNDYDTSDYLIYDGYGSTYMMGSIFSRSTFVDSWNNQFGYWQGELAAKDEEIAFKQQQIESANRQYQILSGQYDDLTNSYNTLQSNYDTLQTNNNALQSNYDTLQTNYNTLQTNYNTLNNDYNSLQSDYDILQIEYDYLLDDYIVSHSQGYTQALNDMDAFKKGLFDIFNAPFEFVRNLTGAEIFGINIFGIFCFFLVFMLGLYLFYVLRRLIF